MANSEQSIVGDLINFRGLLYSPLNENGVVFLFGKVAEDLNMYVEEIKPGFPDCIARRFTGKGWERVRVEFEYKSTNFKQHGHNPGECDTIICWEHDWQDCPLEVIELRDRIKEMENRPIERPDNVGSLLPEREINSWFEKFHIQSTPRKMFEKLNDYIRTLDESCFYKIGERAVSFYCPQRVFIYLNPRKTLLRLTIFTQGRPLGEVKQFVFEKGAEKWGGLSLSSESDLEKALPWIKESYNRIRGAIERNEPTGWYAKVGNISDESDDKETSEE